VPGGWVLAGATSTGTPAATGYALDRVGGRYIALDRYEEVWAAPNGHVAAVVDYERRDEIGLLDLRTEQVRWVATGSHVMTPQWSPDGDRLALTRMDKVSGDITLGVLTSQGTFRTYPVDRQKYFCTDRCFFTWTRDGRHVVLQQSDPDVAVSESRPAARRGIQLFSPDDGRPGAFIPVPGDPAGPWSWSPDGRLVVIRGQDGPRIAEVATGRIVGPAMGDDDVWVNEGRLLHRDLGANAILLIDLEGRELARQSLPQALDHLTLTVGPV
ncbi:TolB family protein, partial [Micromonospora azadirachtae]